MKGINHQHRVRLKAGTRLMMFIGGCYSQGPNRVSTRLTLISSFCERACKSCLLFAAEKQLALLVANTTQFPPPVKQAKT